MNLVERYGPWWGLLVVPSAFLGGLSLAYALVSLACQTGRHGLVHIAPASEVAVEVLGLILSGYCVWRLNETGRAQVPEDRRFLATVSLASAVLFLVATLVQWYEAAALSPCT
jgi:heme/copper-type cytochrome/quinol oxidase subunit 3